MKTEMKGTRLSGFTVAEGLRPSGGSTEGKRGTQRMGGSGGTTAGTTQSFRYALAAVAAGLTLSLSASGREIHVAKDGDDMHDGSETRRLKTISAAAEKAQPGDVITVHEGVYREHVNPPRGGESDAKRITYRAAAGEKVAIKGSEVVKGWTKVGNDTWKVSVPNVFFGGFNPYADEIAGDWFNPMKRKHHTGAVYRAGHWLIEAANREDVLKPFGEASGLYTRKGKDPGLWFAEVVDKDTVIWAQFKDMDPNEMGVEINARQAVFYPRETGCNFITVRGFTLEHAATNWAPPTAEQVGLIGTHWSKGWVIEDNTIRYSVCTGVTLGKHGDKFDNTSANSAEGYVKTIERGLAAGWSKENIGHHIVRNNEIAHCEQAGIVGSLGPVFCTVTHNVIHDIHVRQLFTGAEMGGIKFHAAIDTVISDNHIYRAGRGIWLDWMTQGTHVTRNLVHDISPREDLFVEVNHGPFLVDHNLFLSKISLLDVSEGGAYAHNVFAGRIINHPELRRETPWQVEHGTEMAGLAVTKGGDNRFYNNVFVGPAGLDGYDKSTLPDTMAGNVFLKGAKPSKHEKESTVRPDIDPGIRLKKVADGWLFETNGIWCRQTTDRSLVSSELLGKALVTDLAFVKPDGSPYRLDADYRGLVRSRQNPYPGPFAAPKDSKLAIKVWPPAKPK